MPALQVREFPDELYEELRAYATRNHRSIAQQTVACVENELKRSKALEQAGASAPDWEDIPIPPNVREASARTQTVNPFHWLERFEIEPEEVIEARRERRRRLQEEIAEFNKKWHLPEQSPDEIVQMIREDRDRNHDHLVYDVDDVPEKVREEERIGA